MSTTIETAQVDAYSQHLLADRTMSPADRARHATVAMTVHVAQEYSLPVDAFLPIDADTQWHREEFLETKGTKMLDAVYAQSVQAWEWLQAQYPEASQVWPEEPEPQVLPRLLHVVKEVHEMEVSERKLSLVEGTKEGNSGTAIFEDDPEAQAKFDNFWKGDK